MNPITAFLPYTGAEFTRETIDQLRASGYVERIVLLATTKDVPAIEGCTVVPVETLHGSAAMSLLGKHLKTPYALLLLHDTLIAFGQFGIERFFRVAGDTGAGIVFSDYYDMKEGKRTPHPVIEYQFGSLRDDFNFGSLVLLDGVMMKKALKGPREAEVLVCRMVCPPPGTLPPRAGGSCRGIPLQQSRK